MLRRPIRIGAIVLALLLVPSTAAQAATTGNLTRQIKRCDKKFGGHTKSQRKARQRCIKKAKNAAKRKGSTGQGPGDSSPGPLPPQSQASSSLALATATLHEGVAGLPYVDQLSATGGTAPYTYAVTGLPAGLSGDSSGLISGSPTAIGTSNVGVEVTDADGAHVQGVVTLAVPTTMPADCMQQSCSHLTADGETVQIDGSTVTGVTRDPQTKEVTGLSLTGPAPAPQQIIVVSPTEALPSGLTALVLTATSSGSEETSLTVSQATIGDAYASGTVQAIGSTPPAEGSHLATNTQRHRAASTGFQAAPARPALAGASLNCGSGVSSDLRGLSVKPSLTPSMAAIWHHPLFGGGGFYPGTGGLELFQFDLNGDIQLNMGVSISGKAICTLQLPSLVEAIPAGDLGAVIIETTPTLTLKADGKVDTRASITLSCGVEYRWDQGNEYRGSYCAHHYEPLHLAADTGINVTASGALETAVSLDDVVGVDGSITAALHAGYTPTLQPVAELDASLEYELGACLVCFWKGSPTRVTIAHGLLYHKTIATYDSTPSPPTDNSIQVEGLDFGALPAGQESVEHLTASGGAEPASFAVSPDPSNLAKVPVWVNLESDGTVRIDPPTGTEQSVSFYVYATDATGEHSPYERDLVTFSVSVGGSGMDWSAVDVPVPPDGATGTGTFHWNAETSIACNSSDTCVIPGSYKTSAEALKRMIVTVSDGSRTAISPPVPAGGTSGSGTFPTYSRSGCCMTDYYFNTSPECAPAPEGICVVLGESAAGQMIDTLANGQWSASRIPVPPKGEAGTAWIDELDRPACSEVNTCVFLGGYYEPSGDGYSFNPRSMLLYYAGNEWHAVEASAPSEGNEGMVRWFLDSSMSESMGEQAFCRPNGVCYAIGEYQGSEGWHSVIEELKDGAVSASTVPVPSDGQPGTARFYNGTSFGGGGSNAPIHWCSEASCVVPGEYEVSAGVKNEMLLTLNHGSWEATAAPVPPGGRAGTGSVEFERACSIEACVVLGGYEDEGSTLHSAVDTLVNGDWSASDIPLPPNAISGDVGVHWPVCSYDSSLCLAPGVYSPIQESGAAHQAGMAAEFSAGSWSSAELPVPVGSAREGSTTWVGGAACTVEGTCVVLGEYERTSGYRSAIVDTSAAGIWSSVFPPTPTGWFAGLRWWVPGCSKDMCIATGEAEGSGAVGSIIIGREH